LVAPTFPSQLVDEVMSDPAMLWPEKNHLRSPQAANVAQAMAASLKFITRGDPNEQQRARNAFVDFFQKCSLAGVATTLFDGAHERSFTYREMGYFGLVKELADAVGDPVISAVQSVLRSMGVSVGGKRGYPYAAIVKLVRSYPFLTDGQLKYDVMRESICRKGVPLTDGDVAAIEERIGTLLDCDVSHEKVLRALEQVANENPFHAVADYLRGLTWDGVPRIETILCSALGIDGTRLHRRLLRKWIISAVARALNPGCKVDYILILHGPQSFLKSTFFKVLAGEDHFVDTAISFHDRDGLLVLRVAWILELAELKSLLHARDDNAAKAFITSAVDTYRRPYARMLTRAPRHCIIVGTTNDVEFLTDMTGNRRYPVISVTRPVDIVLLRENRDQLWAEAVTYFTEGEAYWLSSEEEKEIAQIQGAYQKEDPWTERLLNALELLKLRPGVDEDGLPLEDIIRTAAVLPQHHVRVDGEVVDVPADISPAEYQRAAKIVGSLGGWAKREVRVRVAPGRTETHPRKRWFPPSRSQP
jgi:predicted P-loop ATPase